jgi:hypothetical protein
MPRKPTHADAELLLRLYEIRREPEMRRARAWFAQADLNSWDKVQTGWMEGGDQDRWLRMVVTYWEMVATLVNKGVLHEELFFDTNGEDVFTWRRCEPWVEGVRAMMRPTYLGQLEACVRRHVAFREKQNRALQGKSGRKTAPRRKKR